jgi:hypothetical protein
MGGPNSAAHNMYRQMCRDVFVELRRHSSLFFNLLLLLPMADPPIVGQSLTLDYLERELSKRFLPGLSDQEAIHTLDQWMDSAQDAKIRDLYDHSHTIARKKIISNTLSYTANTVSSVASSIGGAFTQMPGFLSSMYTAREKTPKTAGEAKKQDGGQEGGDGEALAAATRNSVSSSLREVVGGGVRKVKGANATKPSEMKRSTPLSTRILNE